LHFAPRQTCAGGQFLERTANVRTLVRARHVFVLRRRLRLAHDGELESLTLALQEFQILALLSHDALEKPQRAFNAGAADRW